MPIRFWAFCWRQPSFTSYLCISRSPVSERGGLGRVFINLRCTSYEVRSASDSGALVHLTLGPRWAKPGSRNDCVGSAERYFN